MPELPEVETIRRGLSPVLVGARMSSVDLRRPNLRFPFQRGLAARLRGRRIDSVDRRAKYLVLRMDDRSALAVHLGMTGSLRFVEASGPVETEGFRPQHDHVVVGLETRDGPRRLVYNDPRRFGYMTLASAEELPSHRLFAGIGPEPLDEDVDLARIATSLDRRTPLKVALLDQRTVAGLGNIYVCEALWRSGLSPDLPASFVAGRPEVVRRLMSDVRSVLIEAIEAGGSTLRDYRRADGTKGGFQERFDVYGRAGETCRRPECSGTVGRSVHAGRATFSCDTCQPSA